MSWDGTLGSISSDDLFDRRYSDDQRIVVGNIPIDWREEEMEDLFSPFGKLLELTFFAKSLTGPQSKCNYAYVTLESADHVQKVLDQRPILYPRDPKAPNRLKLSVKRMESRSSESKSTSASKTTPSETVQKNSVPQNSKSSEQKNGAVQNSKSSEPKNGAKKDNVSNHYFCSDCLEINDSVQKNGVTLNGTSAVKELAKKDGASPKGKSTDSKDGSNKKVGTEKKSGDKGKKPKGKKPKEGGEFCSFEGMQHVCREMKVSGREVYDKLAALTTLDDQVSYLFSLLESVKFKNQFPVGKCGEAADWLRKKGNEYYNDSDLKTALDYYSLSLCMAPEFSLQYAQAIGNKSACFADLDMPEAVATHIKVVLSQFGNLIPVVLERKLMARMETVIARLLPLGAPAELHRQLLHSAFQWSPLDFRRSPYITQPVLDFNALSAETFTGVKNLPSMGENPKIPTMSTMVRLQYSDQLGRHLVAGRRIEPGDVIMRTPVGAAYLYTDQYELSHCSYCLRFVTQLIPCSVCPFESFCDNLCLQLAEQSYHWLLCGVIGELNQGPKLGHTKMMLALRLLMTHLFKYRGRMFDFVKEVSKYDAEGAASKGGGGDAAKATTVPGLNKKGVYDHSDFRTVYYMWSDPTLLSSETRRSLAITCAYSMHVITHSPDFFDKERHLTAPKKAELKRFLTKLLYRIRVGLEWNCFEVTDHLQYTVRNFSNLNNPNFVIKSQDRGIGLFYCGTLSLFNHACISNCVYTEQMNGTILVRAINTIEKGDQLTIPYFSYWDTPKPVRLQMLKEMGGFECQCVGCANDWAPSEAKQNFADLTLTPVCLKCRTPKTVKPDKESKKCNKCKDVINIQELRELVQSLFIASKLEACQLQITSRSRIAQELSVLQGLQAVAMPHTCRELVAIRRSMVYNLSRGDKSYLRPVLRTDVVQGKVDIQARLDDLLDRDVFEY